MNTASMHHGYLNTQHKYVAVKLFTQDTLSAPAESKVRVGELESQVASYMESLGMQETELFGLAVPNDDGYMFVNGENKISKYASRQWKQSTNGLDSMGNPLLQFEYRVRCYIQSHQLIQDPLSRFHYYLQLRENVLRFRQPLREDRAVLLASLALQADLGDTTDKHGCQYNMASYVPQWLIDQLGVNVLAERISNQHKRHTGLSSTEAQGLYIKEASRPETPHNLHIFPLRRKKHDPLSQIALTVCDQGVGIYEEDPENSPADRKLIQGFLWPNIGDLSFEKKKFEIRAHDDTTRFTFYTNSDERSKHLLHLCRLTHQFSRHQRPRLTDVRKSNHDRLQSRDSFLATDSNYASSSGNFQGMGVIPSTSQGLSMVASNISNVASNSMSDPERHQEADSGFGHGYESVSSVARSHSIASSNRTDSSDIDDKTNDRFASSCSRSESTNWDSLSSANDGNELGRSGSMQSSSSQHSRSTIRSKYANTHSHPRPEFTLGAELADLSLAPDIPELADLSGMAADIAARGKEVPDSAPHVHTTHNCCSTCCDDTASIGSDEEDNDQTPVGSPVMCSCDSNNKCLLHMKSKHTSDQSNLMFSVASQYYPSNMFQPHETLPTQYSDEDFHPIDNSGDYVEFYKSVSNFADPLVSRILNEQQIQQGNRYPIDKSKTSTIAMHSNREHLSETHQDSRSKNSSPQSDEQGLDYSVESAQGILANSYKLNPNILPWQILPQSVLQNYSANYKALAPVPMSKIKTLTPISIAASTNTNNQDDSNDYSYDGSHPEIYVSESSVTDCSEAPAKFITYKHPVTVQKAHTQLASTTAPSFSSVPLARQGINTLPMANVRLKWDSVQSLQRMALPDPRPLGLRTQQHQEEIVQYTPGLIQLHDDQIPVIRKNNYVDVHESANISKERMRNHQKQAVAKVPRSLFFKKQDKKLQQQVMQTRHQYEQLQKQILDDTVYQPAAYARGVGVPLHPQPTLVERYPKTSHQTSCRSCDTQNCCVHSKSNSTSNVSVSQRDKNLSNLQNIIYQPHIRNFFQNPPPPAPHPGYGIGACQGGGNVPVSQDTLPNIYQPASDPGSSSLRNITNQSVLATVYTNQLNLSQIEQFNAQLNSDTDYVIYPHKDPSISRQEYMDAKQSQVIATQAQRQLEQQLQASSNSEGFIQLPPAYQSPKSSPLYRSTPNVAITKAGSGIGPLSSYPSFQSLASHGSTHQPGSSSGYSSMARGRYFSQQSLASSFSSVPSGCYSASTQSLSGSFDPYSEPSPLPNSPTAVMRARSDESILSSTCLNETDSYQSALSSRVPPPPYRSKEFLEQSRDYVSSSKNTRAVRKTRSKSRPRVTLQQVRECSSQLDVPLISALCSDSSLHQAEENECDNSNGAEVASDQTTQADDQTTNQERFMKSLSTSGLKYSLSGIYTTNQVPAPQSRSKNPKNKNGVHHHPKKMSKSLSSAIEPKMKLGKIAREKLESTSLQN